MNTRILVGRKEWGTRGADSSAFTENVWKISAAMKEFGLGMAGLTRGLKARVKI